MEIFSIPFLSYLGMKVPEKVFFAAGLSSSLCESVWAHVSNVCFFSVVWLWEILDATAHSIWYDEKYEKFKVEEHLSDKNFFVLAGVHLLALVFFVFFVVFVVFPSSGMKKSNCNGNPSFHFLSPPSSSLLLPSNFLFLL